MCLVVRATGLPWLASLEEVDRIVAVRKSVAKCRRPCEEIELGKEGGHEKW